MATTKYTEEFVKALCKKVAEAASKEEFEIPLSPKLIANMQSAITKNGIPATQLLIGSAVWSAMIADTSFQTMMDVVSNRDEVLTGRICVLFGMDVLTDVFFSPDAVRMPRNFCAVVAVKPGEEPEVIESVCAYVE